MATLDRVLNSKGRDVATIPSDQFLIDASRLLDSQKIGAVVALTDAGEVCGVLSERDIVRRIAREGASALTMKVSDAMTRSVITAAPTQTVQDGLALMTDGRIRHLPVVSNGSLEGIVSIGDLVKWKIAETEAEAEAMKSYIASG